MKKETPVLLLTGYLGSGKTTLLNRILTNRRGIKFAVIVNDIGEVNIDADLIQKGGIVSQEDDSLVALQNGCICCTLKMNLVQQLQDILAMQRFDYIVIEASGICEPAPIAQTLCSIPQMGADFTKNGIPVLDCIVTVVDALRMQSEFGCGDELLRKNIEEDDIENLVIQQIEFCNIVLLNKASEVTPSELGRVKEIIHALQPVAPIIECDYGDVDFDKILNTKMFDFDQVAASATWIREVEAHREEEDDEHEEDEHHHHHNDDEDEYEHEHEHEHDHDHDHDHHHHHEEEEDEHHHHDHEEGHGHHHHHHHDHEGGEVEEYGIGTFVYYRRKPFRLSDFDDFVARKIPKNVIRIKGICYFRNEMDSCYMFEQAGKQISLKDIGLWFATLPPDELQLLMERDATFRADWDDEYGDRMQKLVFIGQKMDTAAIARDLDACLVEW